MPGFEVINFEEEKSVRKIFKGNPFYYKKKNRH